MNDYFDIEENPEVSIWVEKYRPTRLEDYIGNEHMTKKVETYLKNGDIPHLLFYGKQGTGKTTLAKIITHQLGDGADVLYINASDENSVDKVRNDIKQFASSVGMSGGLKIVVLDEFDYMSQNAQAALRNLMETFVQGTRFILTANYKQRIIEPIQSRVQSFRVKPPTKKKVLKHVCRILDEENVEYDRDLYTLIDKYYPDIRKIINEAQLLTDEDNVLTVDTDALVGTDFNMGLLKILKNGSSATQTFKDVRQYVADNEIKDFDETYQFLYEKVDEYATGSVAQAILYIADAQYKSAMVVDKEINFMSCMINIIQEI